MHPAAKFIREALREKADPARAPDMARYMKHKQRFLGVRIPEVRKIVRAAAREFEPASFPEFEALVRELWEGPFREERYAAMYLAAESWPPPSGRHFSSSQGYRSRPGRAAEALPLYEWMVETGQWWDLVDFIAANLIGPLILTYPGLRRRVFAHIRSPDLWLRRTALLAQLKLKGDTDPEVLAKLILRVAHEKEFFIRKAIGWALREYGKTDPDFVRAFVAANEDALSGLSRREALKHL